MSNIPPIVDQSLEGYSERVFLPPNVSANGNYADSAISAALVDTVAAPAVAVIDGTSGNNLNIVLFTSDALAALTMHCWAANASVVEDLAGGAGSGGYEQISADGFVGTQAAIGSYTGTDLVASGQAAGPAGQQTLWTINAATPVLNVPGYGVQVAAGPTLQNDALGIRVDALSQSGVIHGWARHAYADADIGSSVTSVILAASEYTQAIRDAGNLFTVTTAGPPLVSDVYRVVGVWESVAA
jgi:hypothetical protein